MNNMQTNDGQHSQSICILPFIHLATKPNGSVRYCCSVKKDVIRDDAGVPVNFGHTDIDDIWNLKSLRVFRQKMINGEKPSACASCWSEEAIGKKSKRQKENELYLEKFKERIASAKINDGCITKEPVYFDFRAGNTCNLKCRSCSGYFSSTFAREVVERWDDSFKFKSQMSPNSTVMMNWFKTDQFKINILKMMPDLEHVYVAGGEPTLIPEVLTLLHACIESKKSKNILLRYHTNLSHIPEKFYSLISQFGRVSIGISLDGFGDKLTYLRHPLSWSTVEQNLNLVSKLPIETDIIVNCTVTLVNVLYLEELIEYFHLASDKKIRQAGFSINIAHEPEYLNINILSPELKAVAIGRIQKIIDRQNLSQTLREDLISIIEYMSTISPENVKTLREDFVDYTIYLDRIRGESFENTFPELAHLLTDWATS